jgi:hypothetical protein
MPGVLVATQLISVCNIFRKKIYFLVFSKLDKKITKMHSGRGEKLVRFEAENIFTERSSYKLLTITNHLLVIYCYHFAEIKFSLKSLFEMLIVKNC